MVRGAHGAHPGHLRRRHAADARWQTPRRLGSRAEITVAEAIRAYTWGSAYASFEEKIKGSIEPGKLADMAVLSSDILTIDPAEIAKVKVAMTVFDGRVIYDRHE
ncbi:MAG TPA: amidohydrolase family protein [Bryobacteraceae bacterium]|nr:amidohydrolase family protein [Bryobacteraceae bacterium]